MPELYYKNALKLGQKEYRHCVSAGEYPYLPVLDDMVPPEQSMLGDSVGLASVPSELIVGTKSRGRTNAFARNFMPLLETDTEFGQKWERLCQSHLAEGIRDPVKVYEYLNRYYVQEGNKRVSVLRYFDAVSISAQVIRVMPKDTDSEEVQRYLEYLAFNRLSGVNYIELSRKESYIRLHALVGKGTNEAWNENDQKRFSAAYYSFKKAYESAGGNRLITFAGDALLVYLEIYGYETLCASSQEELKKTIARMWEEVKLKQEGSPIDLKTEPAKEKKVSLISRVASVAKPVKAAFIYDKNPHNSAWAYGHELGRMHVQETLQGRIETSAYCDAIVNGEAQTIEKAIADGNRVLFTTSPRLLPASLQAAVAHPEVMVFSCALNQSHRYIRTYYPRIYEVKFIIGAIAGAMTTDGNIGYICDYPIYGQIAAINAFALGVQLVNPRARVVLEWSSVIGTRAARKKLVDQGLRLVSAQDYERMGNGNYKENGLILFSEEGETLLAASLWKWDIYYEEILRRLLDRTMQEEYAASKKALNYYWGMDTGVVDIQWSETLPDGVRKLAGLLKQAICRDVCNPFRLPIRDQSGKTVAIEGDVLELEQIMGMDWLVENIIGTIPAYDELKAFSKATVDVMGVGPSTKEQTLKP